MLLAVKNPPRLSLFDGGLLFIPKIAAKIGTTTARCNSRATA